MGALEEQKKKGSPLISALKLVLAAGLIALVLSWVDFRDRLELPRPGEERTYHGRLNLSSSEVGFESTEGDRIFLGLDEDGSVQSIRHEAPNATRSSEDLSSAPWLAEVDYQQGLISLIRGIAPTWAGLALICYLTASLIAAFRWWLLLGSAGIGVRWFRAVRLSFLGLFCNNFVPGLTGGDLVKAVYIARAFPKQRADAVMSVIVDRLMGITGLALIAAIAVWVDLDMFSRVAFSIYGFFGALLFFGGFFFSRRVRKKMRLDTLLRKLPFAEILQKIDRSIFLYRHRLPTVFTALGLSVVVHSIILTGIGALGLALSMEIPFYYYYALVPVALIAQSLPISPQGLGVGELAFVFFFTSAGVSENEAVALSLCYRLVMTASSLLGGVFLATEKNKEVVVPAPRPEPEPDVLVRS